MNLVVVVSYGWSSKMDVDDFQWLVAHMIRFNTWRAESARHLVRKGVLVCDGDWCKLSQLYHGFAVRIAECRSAVN